MPGMLVRGTVVLNERARRAAADVVGQIDHDAVQAVILTVGSRDVPL